MKNTKKLLLSGVCLIFLLVLTGYGAAQRDDFDEPEGEWVPITITAKGGGAPPPNAVSPAQARLMTERAAKVDAMRNLLEQAYGVRIKSRTTVKDFITQSDTIKARVNAFIRGAKVVDTKYLSDGGVEVEMELVLGYDFRRIFP